MKTCIVCSRKDEHLAFDLLRLLRTLGVSWTAWTIGSDWKDDEQRLDEALSPSSHIIVVLTVHSASSSWLPFVAGYSLGADRPLLLYHPSREPLPQPYLAPFSLLQSLEELSVFLETERKEWTEVSVRRDARRELLELGVSFHGQAFADSVREGNMHAVQLFIRAGLPVDSRDQKGVPLLCLAARTGNRAMLDLLLRNRAAVDTQAEDRGNTALMDAVAGGFRPLAEDLLAAGATVEHCSKDGQTALVIAVGKNDAETAAILLSAGADPDTADKLGLSARKYARLFHNPDLTVLMDRYPPKK